MDDLTDSFETLMDTDLWVDAVVILAAFLAPTVLRNVLAGRLPFEMPGEGYGIIVIVGAQYLPDYQAAATTGGAVYTVDQAVGRTDLKQRVMEVGA